MFCLGEFRTARSNEKQCAYGPEFMLVKGFVVCTNEERLYAHAGLQQVLRKLIFSSTWLRNWICDKLSAHHEGCPRGGYESWIV